VYRYFAYGLGVKSELCIPQFQQYAGATNLVIRLSKIGLRATTSEYPVHLEIEPDFITLELFGIAQFRICEGKEIIIAPYPSVDETLLRVYLTGIVTGLLLYQLGFLVLHASSVVVGGSAIAFIGPEKAGKSSLAAALYMRGYPVLADDNTALRLDAGSVQVYPGFPQLKLNSDTGSALGFAPDDLTFLHSSEVKRGLNAVESFPRSTLPLRCAYVLSTNGTEMGGAIERISSREALLELVRNSIPTRFRMPDEPNHFRQCGTLAERLPLFRLHRPQLSVTSLPELAAVVESHASSVSWTDKIGSVS
jgi:hypothetical protein